MMYYQEICEQVVKLSIEIGSWMFDERKNFKPSKTEEKTFNNLVSYVDQESERRFIEGLKKIIPNSDILGEEGIDNENSNSDWLWIIDPLDGTTNYIHGIPAYCTSVALQKKGRTVIGVIYEPNQRECFYAFEGGIAYLNGDPITVSSSDDLKHSLLATGFPYDYFDKMEGYMELLKHLMKNSRGVRRIGAAALDLCYVASGRFDAFFELALQPWDVAAGSFIVKQAGGHTTDFKNGNEFIYGAEIVASNKHVHNQILQQIEKFI